MGAVQTESQDRPREAVVAGLPARYDGLGRRWCYHCRIIIAGLPARYSEMRTAKFCVFCSLSATKLQGTVAVGDVVVVIVVRQSAGYDAMRGVKCYLF